MQGMVKIMDDNANHNGHREKMRMKLTHEGIDALTGLDVLEMMLYHCFPRGDTRQLAKKLIERFGSFSKVLDASVDELILTDGIGKKTAELITCIPHYTRYYTDDLQKSVVRVYDLQSTIDRLKPKFFGKTIECVALLLLNAKGESVYEDIIWEGSISHVPMYVRRIVNLCIHYDANLAVLAHNHTSGNPTPSGADIQATKEIQFALQGIHVVLDDHIIFTNMDFTSFKRSGWLADLKTAVDKARQEMIISAKEAEKELGF